MTDRISGVDCNIVDASEINRSAERINNYRVLALAGRREDRISEVQLLE